MPEVNPSWFSRTLGRPNPFPQNLACQLALRLLPQGPHVGLVMDQPKSYGPHQLQNGLEEMGLMSSWIWLRSYRLSHKIGSWDSWSGSWMLMWTLQHCQTTVKLLEC
uniref:Uncharacterized protein n=1 Tax=Opuntia streptacantha TaxID=393608 RepID=A0A7C9A307_OPUST